MNRRLFILSTSIGLILAGCSLAPQYIQPQSPIPKEWPQGTAYPTTPDLSRQEFFPDEQLQKVIGMALKNNRDLRLAILNVERSRALYGVQRAELFPAVNAIGGGGKEQFSDDLIGIGSPKTIEQYNLDLGVASWEIDFFGRLRSLKDQALEEYLATDEARRGAEITLVSEVATVYLTLAADREEQKLAQATLESQQAAYALVQKRYEVGIATELDLKRAEVPMDTARGDVARFTQLVAQDQNALQLLVGSAIPKKLLPTDLESVIPPKEISPGLSSEGLLRRPDIMAAEHRLKGSYAYIGAARAAFFPRISLTTSLGTASDELSGLFSSGSGTWNFTPRIILPIFDARVWAALRVSKTDREIVLTQYEKVIQTAFKEVADALAVQGAIDQQIAAQQSLVSAFAVTYRLANKLYIEGVDSYLSVLDAQRSHFAAHQNMVTLRLTKLVNLVRLYAVLGGGGGK
ncbi:MAG: efflux transporter outer membrane subunit [Desulforhopalus sp.]